MKRSKSIRAKKIIKHLGCGIDFMGETYCAVNNLSWEDAATLFDYLDEEERVVAARLLETFANLGTDTKPARKAFPFLTKDESDEDLIRLAQQLRSIWPTDKMCRVDRDICLDSGAEGVTLGWLIRHPLDFSSDESGMTPLVDWRWLHHRGLGAYRPFANLHARVARAYLMNKHKFAARVEGSPVLTICVNCGRYFVPKQITKTLDKQQKCCLAAGCRQYRNRVKANYHNNQKQRA